MIQESKPLIIINFYYSVFQNFLYKKIRLMIILSCNILFIHGNKFQYANQKFSFDLSDDWNKLNENNKSPAIVIYF